MVAMSNLLVKTSELDNVGVVVSPQGMQAGSIASDGTKLLEDVPMGHKVAIRNIALGADIIRFGHTIGFATIDIKVGEWIKQDKVMLPPPPPLDTFALTQQSSVAMSPLSGYTFQGFRNADGSVGTKNVLGITNSVQCVAGLTKHVVKKIKEELLPHFPNVDDVVGLTHSYGCGIAMHAPASMIPIKTLQNISVNPNFGGEVMVIGLGCEKLRPERLVPNASRESEGSILYMQDPNFQGFSDMVDGALDLAKNYLKKLNTRRRITCPASELVVGMQCGGSDSFSGITANPVAGFASDLIVRAGGSVMFSEVTEVRDAIQLLLPRTSGPEVGRALVREMQWYDTYLANGGVDRSENTSPGNRRGGLSTIVEKSLGSIAKSGSSPIVDVVSPGERIRKKGLSFVATPASDFVCGTLQLAAGMNIHLFMTGRGSPYGLPMVPVIKVGSNSELSARWHDLIDFDAGKVATGEKSIEELGWDLFHLILAVASGKKRVACDRLGLSNDLVLFNPGPLT